MNLQHISNNAVKLAVHKVSKIPSEIYKHLNVSQVLQTERYTRAKKTLDTYRSAELVLEPGEVECQVRAIHGLTGPAGQLCNDTSSHVYDECVWACQKVEEGAPHTLTVLPGILLKDFHSGLVLLEEGGRQDARGAAKE